MSSHFLYLLVLPLLIGSMLMLTGCKTPPTPPVQPELTQKPPSIPEPPQPTKDILKQDQNAPKSDNGSIEKHTDLDLETQDTAGNTTPSERNTVNSSTQKPDSAPQAPLSSPAPHEAQTNEERASDMDKQLQESLSKFDGKLLKQRTLLEGLRDADAGGEPLGGAVGDVGETGDADSNAQGGTSEESRPTISASEDLPEASTGTPGKPERGGTRPATIPPDIPDGRDDDIVARQIREAAMREKDPKLREKLWEEYRKYKQSSGAHTL